MAVTAPEVRTGSGWLPQTRREALIWLAWFAFSLVLYNASPLYSGDWDLSLGAISSVGAVGFATISMRTNRRHERKLLGLPVRSWWRDLFTEMVIFATAIVVVIVWVS